MEQAEDLRAEGAALYELIQGIGDDEWAVVTPFKNYTVQDVISHLHTTDIAATIALREPERFRELAAKRDPALRVTSGGGSPADLDGPALREQWIKYLNELCDLLTGVDIKMRVPWFGPDMSVRMFASARQMETWAHGQDIYDLKRAPRTNTDRIRNIAQIGVRTYGWTFVNRGERVPEPAPYVCLTSPSGDTWEWNEPSETNCVKGDAVQFCHVVTQGRNIADVDLEVVGENASTWMAVAQCFAGGPNDPPAPGVRAWS